MQKRWLKILVAVVAVIILVLILVPLFVNGETFRPTVEAQLSSALGRKVDLGHLSFSLFSGSLVAQNIAIADDPAFSASPFVRARQLKVGVEIAPLIFSRQVHVTRLNIDQPSIQLIQNQAGKWNFSSIGGNQPHSNTPQHSSGSPEQRSSGAPDLTVGQLKITNGSASLSSVPATSRPFVYSGVDLTVKNFSFTSNFPFDLSANLPANGTLKLTGTAGPISPTDASETPFQASLHIAHLDPVAAGIVDAGKGISTVADIDARFSSTGTSLTGSGKIKASKLQLSRTGSPAPQPVDIDFDLANDLRARTGRVKDIAIHAGSASAHVTGTYRMTPQAINLDLHLAAPNLPVDQLEQLLPAFGVQIPSGSQLKGGTLTANLTITGPATATTIAGPAEIDNTQLAGFSLGSKIQGLNALSGGGGSTAGGTQIQTLRAKLDSTPQSTQISDIYGNLPQLGTATGSGTVSPSGALNFKMVATLNSNNVVGSVANQAVNTATGFLGGLLHGGSKAAPSNTPHGIPLTITGTSSSPSIRADIGGLLK
jgi:AsmA protein